MILEPAEFSCRKQTKPNYHSPITRRPISHLQQSKYVPAPQKRHLLKRFSPHAAHQTNTWPQTVLSIKNNHFPENHLLERYTSNPCIPIPFDWFEYYITVIRALLWFLNWENVLCWPQDERGGLKIGEYGENAKARSASRGETVYRSEFVPRAMDYVRQPKPADRQRLWVQIPVPSTPLDRTSS